MAKGNIEINLIDKVNPANVLARLHCQSVTSKAWTSTEFSNLLNMPSTSCFVSTLHEDPIGFLLFSCSGVEAEIIMICTIPEQREKGAANKLANALFEHLHLKNVRDVFLEVNPDNTPALKLYHKLGFEQVGRRKNYYKSAEGFSTDALVMKRIPPNFGGF